jgi:SAM-dependent methyltransferase
VNLDRQSLVKCEDSAPWRGSLAVSETLPVRPTLCRSQSQVLRVRLRRWFARRGQPWRTRSDPVRGRRHALREEVGYWDDWLAAKGGKWHEEYAYRFDPSAEVADPALRDVLAQLPEDQIAVLDVGAGPASIVGCRFPGKTIVLVPVDPLADRYDRLLEQANVAPPVRVIRAEGERLLEKFGPDAFDIAYSRNALDHAIDPPLIVDNMLAVVRSGGYVVLRHVRNEAVSQAYVQLHQWNFDQRDGHFVIWRPGQETDMTLRLAGRAEVNPFVESEWIVCVIRKLAEHGAERESKAADER